MNYVIWGAGVWGRQCFAGIKNYANGDDRVSAFVDNNPFLMKTQLADVPIVSPNELKNISYDKIIICSKFACEHIKKQLIDGLNVPGEKIIRFLIDPLPIRIDIDASKTYLALLGEFGVEMIAWLPYLTYLKSKGIKLKTISRKGSSVFYENVSEEHIEVGNEYIGYGGYGFLNDLEKLKMDTGLSVFAPCKELRAFSIFVNGIEWQIRDFHSRYPTEHLLRPEFKMQDVIHIKKLSEGYKGIVTINNKSYVDCGAGLVRNCLLQEEVEGLFSFLTSNNYFVVYNDFSEAFKEGYENSYDMYLPKKEFNRKNPAVLFLSDYSDGTENKWDRMQLECWQNSDFVIQHPGVRKFNFMQKGEYQDDLYLSKLYGGQSDTFYEVRHMIAYIEKEMREGRL